MKHIDRLHTKLYLAASAPGALNMMLWECDTAACRSGWINRLVYGSACTFDHGSINGAAEKAYRKHGYDVAKLEPDWWRPSIYSNEEALSKMLALALMECAGAAISGAFE
jgi:hypothetical protein